MSGAVGSNNNNLIVNFINPIKIATYNIAGFEKYEIFGEPVFDNAFLLQYCRLNAFCISYTFLDVGMLLFNSVLLSFYLVALSSNLFFLFG
jgi:hypothetical protein